MPVVVESGLHDGERLPQDAQLACCVVVWVRVHRAEDHSNWGLQLALPLRRAWGDLEVLPMHRRCLILVDGDAVIAPPFLKH